MICIVTDRQRFSAGANGIDRVVELAHAAARAGIDLFQIRERDLDARTLTALAARCRAAAEGTRTRILVNDRADVAVAAAAHGVHLRADSFSAPAARLVVGKDATIGRSVHTVQEATEEARAGAVNYLIFGTMHQTPSKMAAHSIATVDDLRNVCSAAAGHPVLAIGGMTVEGAAEVARAGAAGIAGISLFVPPGGRSVDQHLQEVAAELRRVFDTCGAVP